ncbi:sporulation associated protein [Colletotrichum truncatum]|uniref:Sporulation associated protein n=1 Tax=Colletotrichum truncatum TaxID=5467 RepID=A0ACC3YLT9_COLTU|nr:sporulation associated protein [Colletotrichum truncatum]KAF6791484.1 sporulation associated protein [Colletotrichum truncatum]
MSFSSEHSQGSMDTALSSVASPLGQEFNTGRWRQRPTKPRNLVLFFDGTGNAFTGSEKDTNVVKLLSMLDRNHEEQFHYYQTGIGTYSVNEETIHQSPLAAKWSKAKQQVDGGIGKTFDAHVLAGYRFLMRYYETGDKIYMFGFSRGAYTAKFLARMVHTVGLLCKGNEEMVPFAYRLYDRHLDGEFNCKDHQSQQQAEDSESESDDGFLRHKNGNSGNEICSEERLKREKQEKKERRKRNRELRKFSNTFCRKEPGWDADGHPSEKETNIKVHFLGLWDCVNSVAVMEKKATKNVKVKGTAHIIRHAVAVDERRVKFKAALFHQDRKQQMKQKNNHEDIKEVWFVGNHGDVGGGWHPTDDKLPTDDKNVGFWERLIWSEEATEEYKNASFWKKCYMRYFKKVDIWAEPSVSDDDDWNCQVCKECGLCKAEKCQLLQGECQLCKNDECQKCHDDIVCKDPKHMKTKRLRPDPCQLSDIPLAWMVKELELKGDLKWRHDKLNEFKHRYQHNKQSALNGSVHDPVMFGFGTSWKMVLFWNFLEYFPLIQRWELTHGGSFWSRLQFWKKQESNAHPKWDWVRFPLNKGATRDIPEDAILHQSLFLKLEEGRKQELQGKRVTYNPQNNHGGSGEPCLSNKEGIFAEVPLDLTKKSEPPHPDHKTYHFQSWVNHHGGHVHPVDR